METFLSTYFFENFQFPDFPVLEKLDYIYL